MAGGTLSGEANFKTNSKIYAALPRFGVIHVKPTFAKSAVNGAVSDGLAVVGRLPASRWTSAISIGVGKFQGGAAKVAGSTCCVKLAAGLVSANI